MDRLSNEMIPKLLEHLELDDLWNCRLVNKRFKFFVDQTKVKQLVIANSPPADLKKCWFVTKNMIDIEENAISPNSFNGYRFVFNLKRHLKRLCLNFKTELTLNMAILDHMQIEQLDVKCGGFANQSVELPQLKILELTVVSMDDDDDFEYGTLFVRAANLVKM